LLNLLGTPLALLSPLPLKIAVDSVVSRGPLPGLLSRIVPLSIQETTSWLLVFAVALLVAVELLSQLQSMTKNLLRTYTAERLSLQFRAMLFRHAQRLSLAYHDRRGTADANPDSKRRRNIPKIAVEGIIRSDRHRHVRVNGHRDCLSRQPSPDRPATPVCSTNWDARRWRVTVK
jgi:ATP-binding cassette subfamily B protein